MVFIRLVISECNWSEGVWWGRYRNMGCKFLFGKVDGNNDSIFNSDMYRSV